MTITRETLELAALAAGHTITSFEPVGPRGALVAMLGVNAAVGERMKGGA